MVESSESNLRISTNRVPGGPGSETKEGEAWFADVALTLRCVPVWWLTNRKGAFALRFRARPAARVAGSQFGEP